MSKVWYSDNEWPARARKLKFGGCLRGVKRVSGRCLEGVWEVSGWCLGGIWKVSV